MRTSAGTAAMKPTNFLLASTLTPQCQWATQLGGCRALKRKQIMLFAAQHSFHIDIVHDTLKKKKRRKNSAWCEFRGWMNAAVFSTSGPNTCANSWKDSANYSFQSKCYYILMQVAPKVLLYGDHCQKKPKQKNQNSSDDIKAEAC